MSNSNFGVRFTSNSKIGVRIVSQTADANLSIGVGGVRGSFPINVTPLLGGLGGDVTNLRENTNKSVLSFDYSTGKFVFLSPDEIVDSAVADTPNVGLSTSTINYLDQALDDKIDLDAGTFS
jgi:hypothetical protein